MLISLFAARAGVGSFYFSVLVARPADPQIVVQKVQENCYQHKPETDLFFCNHDRYSISVADTHNKYANVPPPRARSPSFVCKSDGLDLFCCNRARVVFNGRTVKDWVKLSIAGQRCAIVNTSVLRRNQQQGASSSYEDGGDGDGDGDEESSDSDVD